MQKLIIYTDGASRGNPGPAAVGFVVQDSSGTTLFTGYKFIGIATNNIAEYSAVKISLQKVLEEYSTELPLEVEYRGDSQLIMSQLSGKYKIKNEGLRVIYDEIKKIESQVGRVTYTYTPRANNSVADGLANKALDEVR